MFPFTDPQIQLDLHHRHAEELRREAADRRLGRPSEHVRHKLFQRRPRPVRAPVVP